MTPARRHLVWDWNGTLFNDLDLVVASSNAVFASVGGPSVTLDEHRLGFRWPVTDYYGEVLGRAVDGELLLSIARVFLTAYQDGLVDCRLADDAAPALAAWPGTQSLLSMWRHDDLLRIVHGHGLSDHFVRIDGRKTGEIGEHKAELLRQHLENVGVDGDSAVLIGDSLDDAEAAESVGAEIVLYSGGYTDPARLRSSTHPVVETLMQAVKLATTL